jgi:hypothetical protein
MMPPRRAAAAEFSPIENEPPLRWWRQLNLVPADGLGAGRRALFLALLTWLPIAVWAVLTGRADGVSSSESLLHHYGVHVRCLVVIPLLILAEPMLQRRLKSIAARLAQTAVADPLMRARFDAASAGVVGLWNASPPWILGIGLAIAWSLVDRPHGYDDVLSWALDGRGALGFGGWWFGYVVRPIFLVLVLGWLWRIVLICWWFWRIGKLELSLVPTHPDRAGGIAFVEKLPTAFALVTLAVSAQLASRWAHEILHHAASLDAYRQPVILFAVLWTLLLLMPLFGLLPALNRVRSRSMAEYSELVGKQGRLVHRRWIEGAQVGSEPILDAPEIGPVADAAAMYESVKKMRRVPIGKASLISIAVPLALPLVLAAALQIPLKELLFKLAKALV